MKSNCFFLPLRTPEEILWKCSEKSPHTVINELKKDAYKIAIADAAKEDMCGDVSANDIFCFQKKLCNAIPRNNEKILEIVNTVKNIIE